MISASRIKNSLHVKSNIPNNCNKKIELVLYTDRKIFDSKLTLSQKKYHNINLLEEMKCIFDRIIYIDDFPSINIITSQLLKMFNTKDEIYVRLSTRTNLLKLLTLLSSPYEYTLYLGKIVIMYVLLLFHN